MLPTINVYQTSEIFLTEYSKTKQEHFSENEFFHFSVITKPKNIFFRRSHGEHPQPKIFIVGCTIATILLRCGRSSPAQKSVFFFWHSRKARCGKVCDFFASPSAAMAGMPPHKKKRINVFFNALVRKNSAIYSISATSFSKKYSFCATFHYENNFFKTATSTNRSQQQKYVILRYF